MSDSGSLPTSPPESKVSTYSRFVRPTSSVTSCSVGSSFGKGSMPLPASSPLTGTMRICRQLHPSSGGLDGRDFPHSVTDARTGTIVGRQDADNSPCRKHTSLAVMAIYTATPIVGVKGPFGLPMQR